MPDRRYELYVLCTCVPLTVANIVSLLVGFLMVCDRPTATLGPFSHEFMSFCSRMFCSCQW